MNTRHAKVVSLCVLAIGLVAVIWAVTSISPPLVMTVREFTAKQMGSHDYVVATIELTNAGKRPIIYWTRYDARFAEYAVLHQTTTGWKETTGGRGFCGTGLEQCTLMPSEAIAFDAVIDGDKPCKVAVSYSDGRSPNRLWQRLPRSIAQRLPWGSGWNVVTTDAIDLRGADKLRIKRQEPFNKPPQETPAVQAAAQGGDSDAQFRLAGRYLTGSGITKSLTEALLWYEAAATNGHAEAAYNLGTIHEYGLDTAANQATAIEWYRRASDRGHAGAQERLRALDSR